MEENLLSLVQAFQGESRAAEAAERRKGESCGRLEQEERVAGRRWEGGFEVGENRRQL